MTPRGRDNGGITEVTNGHPTFYGPVCLPETDFYSGFQWNMKILERADEYGLSEVWVGEHTTLGWEPVCSPELYLAAALAHTKRIKLATGANLVPNHNPVALAHLNDA